MPSAHRAGVAGRARHSSPRAAAHRRSAGRRCPTRPIPMQGRRVRPMRSPAAAADRAAAIAATGGRPSPRRRGPHGRRAGRRRPGRCSSPPAARNRCSGRMKVPAPARCRPPRARRAASPTTRPRWSPVPRGGGPGDRAAGLRTVFPPAVRRAGRGRQNLLSLLPSGEGARRARPGPDPGADEGRAQSCCRPHRDFRYPSPQPLSRWERGSASPPPARSRAGPAGTPAHRRGA